MKPKCMKSICIFCGSSGGKDPLYLETAGVMGDLLAQRGITLVYGGAAIGLMGKVADAVLAGGGKVIGVLPEFLSQKEIRHQGLTELILVKSMHERKQTMARLAEGFIALPGGFGTLEELCEILTWSQLGLVTHPVGILNAGHYYDKLLELFEVMVQEQFLKMENRQILLESRDPGKLLEKMAHYQPRDVTKWLDLPQT